MKARFKWVNLGLLICLLTNAKGGDLRLAVDHFSRTITAQDTAYYLVETFVKGNKAIHVKLEMRASPVLSFQFSKTLVTTPALVRLQVNAKALNHIGDHRLRIIAFSLDNSISDSLQVSLHVVAATNTSPKLVLDLPPPGQLKKNVPQSLEGAIVPGQAGTVRVHLLSLTSNKETILTTTVDKTGLFHINHVFTEHGNWRAIASWRAQGKPDSVISNSLAFQVKRSPLRLTVAAEKDFRNQQNPQKLRVLGQITPDYAKFAMIQIKVAKPNGASDSLNVLPDPISGKFGADFQADGSGIYQINATGFIPDSVNISSGKVKGIFDEPLYASLTSSSFLPTRNFVTSIPVNAVPVVAGSSCAVIGAPTGYAVIVVGDSREYYAHLAMAYHLRAALIVRRGFRPEDILLRTLSFNPDPDKLLFFLDSDTATLVTRIRTHLTNAISDPNFALHHGLLLFWIGRSRMDGSVAKLQAGGIELNQTDVTNIYASAMRNGLWKSYNKGIVVMHVGDNSGRLLSNMNPTPPSGYIYAGNLGGVYRSMDNKTTWTTFNSGDMTSSINVQAFAVNSNGDLFAGTTAGVFSKTGATWTALNSGDMTSSINVRALAVNSSGHLFAGTTTGIFSKTGATWTAFNSGDMTSSINVRALAVNSSGHLFAGTTTGVFSKTGATWTAFNSGDMTSSINVQALAVNSSGHLFAGTTTGVFSKTGATWTAFNSGDMTSSKNVQALAINSSGDLFAGTTTGVFVFRANGLTWSALNTGAMTILTNVRSLAINSSGHLFAGTANGVLRYTDYDNTWTSFNSGAMISTTNVQTLTINSSVPTKHSISSTPWTISQPEDFLLDCGTTSFSKHFLDAIALDDKTVRGAFKYARGEVVSPAPAIDDDVNGEDEPTSEIDQGTYDQANDATGQINLGCSLNSTDLFAHITGTFFESSLINSPLVGPQGTIFVAVDNPNQVPILRGKIELMHGQQMQCFYLQPVDSSSLWKAQVSYPDTGYFPGKVLLEHEIDGRLYVTTTSFELFRYDTTTAPPTTPPQDGNGINPNFGVNFGVDVNSTSAVSKGTGSVGVTLFSYGQPGKTGYVAFPLLSVGADLNRQWIAVSPVALNVGNIFAEGKVLKKVWLHGGVGYVVRDKGTPSTEGEVILVGGVRTGF